MSFDVRKLNHLAKIHYKSFCTTRSYPLFPRKSASKPTHYTEAENRNIATAPCSGRGAMDTCQS